MGEMADYLVEQSETARFLHLEGQCGETGPCEYCEKPKKKKKKQTKKS